MANFTPVSVGTVFFVLCFTVPLISGESEAEGRAYIPRNRCLQLCSNNRRWLCGMLCGGSGCSSSCGQARDVDAYFMRCQASCGVNTPTVTQVPNRQSCGVSSVGRIVGGAQANECEFPWAVVVDVGSIYCGGSIINDNTVLTAGHCVYSAQWGRAKARSVTIKYGSSDQRRAKTAYVTRINIHPKFVLQVFDYDVALLTLDRKLTFDHCVQPVCLPEVDADPRNTQGCLAAGWGAIEYTNRQPQRMLRKVSLPIIPLSQCQHAYNTRLISNIKICAGDMNRGGIDSCMGDSGGPLMCYKNGAYHVYGVVSFGRMCARAGSPGVYSSVTTYQINSWIRNNM
ncbi:hypothetical protein ACOMHN_052330 [Nucella lapillus]